MNDVEFILGLLETKASKLSALAYAYDCCTPEECPEGACKAELLRAQCAVLSEFAAGIETLIARAADADSSSVANDDERSVLILEIMGQKIATVHRSLDWQAAIDEFENAHRPLVEHGYARCELGRIIVPHRKAGEESGVTIADARWVFIEDVRNNLAASIHNTEADLNDEAEAFQREYRDLIESNDVVWDTHVIVVPPRQCSNLRDS